MPPLARQIGRRQSIEFGESGMYQPIQSYSQARAPVQLSTGWLLVLASVFGHLSAF